MEWMTVLCVALASRLLAHWRPSPRFEPIPLYVLGSLAAMWCFERAAALVR